MGSIIYIILIGLVAGFLAGLIMKGKGFGFVVNILIGIAGALLGSWLLGLFNIRIGGAEWLSSIITALIGAIVLLFLISLFKKKK